MSFDFTKFAKEARERSMKDMTGSEYEEHLARVAYDAALKDRDVVLEEAAKKLDERASYHGDQDQGPRRSAAWREARECAQAIRNLKERV